MSPHLICFWLHITETHALIITIFDALFFHYVKVSFEIFSHILHQMWHLMETK